MKLTETFVRAISRYVSSLVEEESGLKTHLETCLTKLLEFGEWKEYEMKVNKISRPESKQPLYLYGAYEYFIPPRMSKIKFRENYPGNINHFKRIFGHEIFHNAQCSNCSSLVPDSVGFALKDKNEELFTLTCYLPELNNPNDIFNFLDVHGEKILMEKFNGKRREINQLYKAPIEELIKIFKIN